MTEEKNLSEKIVKETLEKSLSFSASEQQIEMSKKIIGLILLSLTEIDANEFKAKARKIAEELIKAWYNI